MLLLSAPEAAVRPTTPLRRLALLVPALLAITLAPAAATAGPTDATDRTSAGTHAQVHTSRADRVLAQLERSARIPGTAWGIDPATGQVVVSVDPTVTGARLATITAIVTAAGDAARIEHLSEELQLAIAGGQAIRSSSGARCTLGINAHAGSTPVFVTAGHCAMTSTTWYDSGTSAVLGTTASYRFPGDDYALIQYTNPDISHPSAVHLYPGLQYITSAGYPYVGQRVWSSGSTTGLRSGYVTALNATVNYPQGTVYGLIRTNICSEPGDSGGPLFAGDVVYGILVGGSGNCTFGGTSYYQPIVEILNYYGLTIP